MQITPACPHESHDNSDVDERYVEWRNCSEHLSSLEGSEDAIASLLAGELQFSGSAESSADTNRAYSKFFNDLRKRRRKK